jgi:hypothetical protein
MPYLFGQFKAENTEQVFKQFHFWIIAGIMFYLAGTFFFNILGNELDKNELDRYWDYSLLADIFKNIFFSIAILIYVVKTSKKPEKIKTLPNLDFTL